MVGLSIGGVESPFVDQGSLRRAYQVRYGVPRLPSGR
jgi:hypothetical protein